MIIRRNSEYYFLLPLNQRPKHEMGEGEDAVADFWCFSERVSSFYLDLRAIRHSKLFGARRKVVLRDKAYAWASVIRSSDKLREVGVPSYLSFTLCLSVFMMLELIEVVCGYLIGPKSWNHIVRKILNQFVQSVTVHGWFGLLGLCFVL